MFFPIFWTPYLTYDQLFDRIYTLWWPCLQLGRALETDCECSQGYNKLDNIMQDREGLLDKRGLAGAQSLMEGIQISD